MKINKVENKIIPDKIDSSRVVPEMAGQRDVTFLEHLYKHNFALKKIDIINKTILDVACGVGYGSEIFSKVAKKVIAVDSSTEAINYSKTRYHSSNLEFKVMEASKLDFPDNYFDVVISIETIAFVKKYRQFINEVHRALKPNGIFMVTSINKGVVPKGKKLYHPLHAQEFTKDELSNALSLNFYDLEFYIQKMGYYRRLYKKLRLSLRYANPGFSRFLVRQIERHYKEIEKIPEFLRIILYELKDKLKIIPYFNQEPYIRPTFYIVICKNK